ncbi:MAG: TRAP transporter substrate-binding protein [Opitutales bacterium]|nr:TRAP transporter substrate-binding protein [Opitutales bacterium]
MLSKSLSQLIVGFIAGVILCCLLFAWILRNQIQSMSGQVDVVQLKFAHVLPTNHPVHKGIVHMANRLKEISGGKMDLVIFPSGQMGDETKCIEQVQIGTLAMTKTSTAPMGNFVELMKVFSLPYLFRSAEHFWRVLDGEIGQEMLVRLATHDDGSATGFIGLGYFDSGSRNFYSKEPILSPADMVGKKFRVMRDPVAMDMVEALGGSPTPIPWGELYTALKQGVVDGAENNPPSIVSSRHSEVCKYLTLDAHSRIPDVVIISEKVWNRLSLQEQEWLKAAMQEGNRKQREIWKKSTAEALEQMKREGVKIIEVDQDPFKEAVASVIEKHAVGSLKDVYNRIQLVE